MLEKQIVRKIIPKSDAHRQTMTKTHMLNKKNLLKFVGESTHTRCMLSVYYSFWVQKMTKFETGNKLKQNMR